MTSTPPALDREPHAPVPGIEPCAGSDADSQLRRSLLELGLAVAEHLAASAAAVDLTLPQARALRLLESPVAMGDLAGTMHCDASNITGIVDRLETRGLLERQVDSGDRRVKRLVVTPAGRDLRGRFEERLFGELPGLARLDDGSRDQLSRLLEAMGFGRTSMAPEAG